MRLSHQFAGCGAACPQSVSRRIATAGAVMLTMIWSGWAAEPKTDGGGQPALRSLGEAGRSAISDQSSQAPVPIMLTPGGTNTGGRAAPFSAEIGADFIKKVMETSAKIEAAKRQISERQAILYATNPEIKATRALMIEGQKEINRILDNDQELAELKMSRDILWSTMPALPRGPNPAAMPRMPFAR